MLSALFRILIGTALACLVAGAVQVLFALNPSELAMAGPDRWELAGWLALQSATAVALIAVPLALLLGIFSEIFAIKSFAFHIVAAVLIAIGGWAVLFSGEIAGEPTLANSYAIATFLSTGFLAGIAYWLAAGQYAGGPLRRHQFRRRTEQPEHQALATTTTTTSRSIEAEASRKLTSAIAKPATEPSSSTAQTSVPATKKPGTAGGAARSLVDQIDQTGSARQQMFSGQPSRSGVIGFDGWFR